MKQKHTRNIYSIYGINNSCELLKIKKDSILKIFLLKNGKASKEKYIQKNITSINNKCSILEKTEFDKKFPNIRSQGIVINFTFKPYNALPIFSDDNICLIIPESIEDPQNLGQIIRTSECAGINGILLSHNRTVGLTNSVFQVSQGAFLNCPIYMIGNIAQTLKMLKSKEWSTGVIANWSENLGKLIKDLGLAPSIGFVSSSAELRCEKPQRAIFERTLFRAGASADSCLYISSDFEQNISAALDSGLNAIWLNRGTNIENERLEGVQIINSLYDVLEVCELTTHDA